MDREKCELWGNELTQALGLENRKVILFWKAFDEERWLACHLLHHSWLLTRS